MSAQARASVPPSRAFTYRDAALVADAVPLARIAEQAGTPCYVYSATAIDVAFRAIDTALEPGPRLVAYALKANANLALLRRLAGLGAGADIVSGGELARALAAGFDPARIVFSGVGKTDAEIAAALATGIRSIHVESAAELDVVAALASARGVKAPIALRINPDVDARTHPYIATGLREAKFGLVVDAARALVPRIVRSPHLALEGIACHIGSLVQSAALGEAVEITSHFATECIRAGAPVRTLDAGGGWPIAYGNEQGAVDDAGTIGRAIREAMGRGGASSLDLVIEPGRSIIGDAGVLLTRVLYVKEQHGKRFVIVDAAMTELLRPSLYDAYHAVMPVAEPAPDARWTPADVVGPVCETGDFLARGRALPPVGRGDLLAVRGAGAYGASMAMNYNARPFAPEILVDGDRVELIRRRQSLESLWRDEV
jgi:diaminopimelate decarboxylase